MEPNGSECYTGLKTVLRLRFPFSLYFIQQLETYRNFFSADTSRLEDDDANYDLDMGTLFFTSFLPSFHPLHATKESWVKKR